MCEGRLGRGQGHPTPDIVTLHHLFPTFSEPVKKWPIKHEHYPKTTITFFHSLTLTLDDPWILTNFELLFVYLSICSLGSGPKGN